MTEANFKQCPVLYIVVPCYNEEEVLPESAKQFYLAISDMMKKQLISTESKILFVNDGSRDKTWDLVENFSKKEFSVSILSGSAPEVITLKSIVPKNTIDYKKALDFLYKDQQNLIKAFCDESGAFNAEIYARIVVKNDKPFWYVGIASGNGNLKALLIDGFSGETLAIREIF